MPIINITLGQLTKEKKKELIEKLVDVSVEVTGAPEHSFSIIINEMPLDAISVGKMTIEEMIQQK